MLTKYTEGSRMQFPFKQIKYLVSFLGLYGEPHVGDGVVLLDADLEDLADDRRVAALAVPLGEGDAHPVGADHALEPTELVALARKRYSVPDPKP